MAAADSERVRQLGYKLPAASYLHDQGRISQNLPCSSFFLHFNVEMQKCRKVKMSHCENVDFIKKKLHQCNNVSFVKFAPGPFFFVVGSAFVATVCTTLIHPPPSILGDHGCERGQR